MNYEKPNAEKPIELSDTQQKYQNLAKEVLFAGENPINRAENPLENPSVIEKLITLYCDADLSKGLYGTIMQYNTDRTFDKKNYESFNDKEGPKQDFEEMLFIKWKNNIINMDKSTAVKLYNNDYEPFKKLQNYLKTIQTDSTQTDVINNCFDDFEESEVARKKFRYNRHSDSGWNYYSSRDTEPGKHARIEADGRLYLNAEPIDTYVIAKRFVESCDQKGLEYEFKINNNKNRADAMVFYINSSQAGQYVNILDSIINNAPQRVQERTKEPPILTKRIGRYLGYGDEIEGTSYNERQTDKIKTAIESVVKRFQTKRPESAYMSSQECARFLLEKHRDDFIRTIQRYLE